MNKSRLEPHVAHVTHLTRSNGGYVARLDDGSQWSAHKVLLGLGFGLFKHYPKEITDIRPSGSYLHTCDTVDFEVYRDRRVLIVGGRQSAVEWAVLIREHGAQDICVTHRHTTPQFVKTDWAWVQRMARRTLSDHGWWRRLAADDRERIRREFWTAGRLELEPWLAPRLQ